MEGRCERQIMSREQSGRGLLDGDGKDGVEQVFVDITCYFLYFSGIRGAH
jgi:hypothetical protein